MNKAHQKVFRALQTPNPSLWINTIADLEKAYTNYFALYRGLNINKFVEGNLVSNPDFKMLGLSSLLIMPIQRMPRYKLLFQEMAKYLENHPDEAQIQSALKRMQNLLNRWNYGIKFYDKEKEINGNIATYQNNPSSMNFQALIEATKISAEDVSVVDLKKILAHENFSRVRTKEQVQLAKGIERENKVIQQKPEAIQNLEMKKYLAQLITSDKKISEFEKFLNKEVKKQSKKSEPNVRAFSAILAEMKKLRKNGQEIDLVSIVTQVATHLPREVNKKEFENAINSISKRLYKKLGTNKVAIKNALKVVQNRARPQAQTQRSANNDIESDPLKQLNRLMVKNMPTLKSL